MGQTPGRQGRAKAGVGHTVLDNGLATCNDPAALQAVCDRLGPTQIQALPDKWLAILPSAFTEADRGAGYRYECSVLQAEFSLTQALDRPVTGRVFFEQVIRDNLDAGPCLVAPWVDNWQTCGNILSRAVRVRSTYGLTRAPR